MMKKLLLAFLALVVSTPALAGPWTVGQQPKVYSTPHIGPTGMNPTGGNAPPAFAYEPADVSDGLTPSDWIDTTFDDANATFPASPASAQEAKARFDCVPSHENHDDPIINPGVIGGATHDHTWVGNKLGSANSTYNILRTTGQGTCFGGAINRSAYWEPSLKRLLASGVTATVKMTDVVTYYSCGDATNNLCQVRIPRGHRMISGFDMTHPETGGNGFIGWTCLSGNGSNANSPNAGQSLQPWLRNGDGTATLTCGTGGIQAENVSRDCWDGVNFDSPNGRDHMAFSSWNGTTFNCPDNWYHIVQFIAFPRFNTVSDADTKELWLDSDRMPGMNFGTVTASGSGTTITTTAASAAMLNAKWHQITGAGIPANTMITNVSGSIPNLTLTVNHSVGTISSEAMTVPFNNGETMHFDVFFAWNYGTGTSPGIMLQFMQNCDGLTMTLDGVTLTGSMHECNFARFKGGVGGKLKTKGQSTPDGILQPAADDSRAGPNRYFPLAHGKILPSAKIHTH